MASTNNLKAAGLHTSPNELSAVPDGALVVADNVVISSRDVIEPRRGQGEFARPGVESGRFKEIHFFQSHVIGQLDSNDLWVFDSTGNGRPLETYYEMPPEGPDRLKAVEVAGSFYFLTESGLRVLEDPGSEPRPAGVANTGGLRNAVTVTGDGFLAPGQGVAYRIVFCKYDSKGRLLMGAPSNRIIVKNTAASGVFGVTVRAPVPQWIDESTFYRLYRTSQFPIAVDPGDEMALVLERSFTPAERASGSAQIFDITPDEFRGAPLYTNPNSGEGILQANRRAPLSRDIAFWNYRLWLSNITEPQRIALECLGVGPGAEGSGLTGLRLGDVLTVNGRRYIGWTSTGFSQLPFYNAVPFRVFTGLTPFSNVLNTIENLAVAINGDSGNGQILASFVSDGSETPGRLTLERITPEQANETFPPFSVSLSTAVFPVTFHRKYDEVAEVELLHDHGLAVGDTVELTWDPSAGTAPSGVPLGIKTVTTLPSPRMFTYTESGALFGYNPAGFRVKRLTPSPSVAWNPPIPESPGLTATGERKPNRIYYSKAQQPESFPLLNYIDVGNESPIWRIMPLRDRLYVFKEDGIYTVSGEEPFRVDLLDNTALLLAPDTVVPLANQIFAFTNQGVVSVGEAGVSIVSRPIEREILSAFPLSFAADDCTLGKAAFACAQEAERRYLLGLPSQGAEVADNVYVYNVVSGVWTRWPMTRGGGRADPMSGQLFMAHGSDAAILAERRSNDTLAYFDGVYETAGFRISLTENLYQLAEIGPIKPGDMVYMGRGDPIYEEIGGRVLSVDEENSRIVLEPQNGQIPWNYGVRVIVQQAFQTRVVWAIDVGGDPNGSKQFRDLTLHFKALRAIQPSATVSTDVKPSPAVLEWRTATPVPPYNSDGPVVFSFPEFKRQLIPLDYQRATYFRFGFQTYEARAYFQLQGYTATFEPISDIRVTR